MSEKIKICFIVGDLPPAKCGIADYSYRLLSALNSYPELDIAVITSKKPSDARKCPIKGICYYDINKWNFGVIKRLKVLIRQVKPDIIHYQHPSRNYGKSLSQFLLPYLLKGRRMKYKWITTFHEFFESPVYAKPWLRILLRFSDSAIFITKKDQHLAYKNRNNSIVIPIGSNILPENIEQQKLSLIKNRLLGNEKFLIGYFGFIDKDKGVDLLLDSFSELRKGGGSYKLIIIGQLIEDNKYHNYIKNRIEKSKYLNDIKVTGYLSESDVSKYLQMMDVCVLPYKKGASLRRGTILAPMVHGIPIITKAGSDSDMLKDGVNVIFYDHPNQIHDKVIKLMSDPKKVKEIKKGALLLSEQFSWEKIAGATRDFYKAVSQTM